MTSYDSNINLSSEKTQVRIICVRCGVLMEESTKFYFVGNNLSLDFVNTLVTSNLGPVDLLENTNDLIRWSAVTGLIERGDISKLEEDWSLEGDEIIDRARRFRSTLHELLDGIRLDATVGDASLRLLNKALARQTGRTEVVRGETGFAKRFLTDFSDPEQILAAIASSAADLICYADLGLIKKCESDECVLIFHDTSKNHSRRWCSMAHCGNLAKARAFYSRKKGIRVRID